MRNFVGEIPTRLEQEANIEIARYCQFRLSGHGDLLPKLLRLLALLIVGTIAFKGVQALIAPAPSYDPGLERKIDDLTALAQQLVANSGRQAPGAERAVSQAVTTAAEGAAAGDARLQQALDLLKMNRVADAEILFRAVAADKAAHIRQDTRDAAVAYRNLGAITGLRDPKAALDAYTKAVELDPDDIDSLVKLAWLQEQSGAWRRPSCITGAF